LLDESLDALLKPFSRAALSSLAENISRVGQTDRPKLLGFIIAGNVAGAGIHEIAIGLVAGAGMIVKTASAEPVFFDQFVRTMAELDSEVGSRLAVFNWGRTRDDLTTEMAANCDRGVAYGDDATIEALRNVSGFGSRDTGAGDAPNARAAG